MKIAIVGGGLTGMGAAKRLLEAGHEVEIFERAPVAGGLAAAFPFGETELEAYYHHIFLSDHALRALIDELGLGDELDWLDSKMGFFVDGAAYPFGTPASLLGFKPLGWLDKLRFGLSVLALQRLEDWRPLEGVTARDWLVSHAGERVYRTLWEPLLKGKFGADHTRVSMAWLWGKIKLRGSTRPKGRSREQLGYMRGSFAKLGRRLAERLEALGATFHLSSAVSAVEPAGDGWEVLVGDRRLGFDRVLLTVPQPLVGRLAPALPPDYQARLQAVRYTGVTCTVLVLDRTFSDLYWLNIGDPAIPFGGLIEHTNMVADPAYGGKHVLYVSHYMPTDHPLYGVDDEALLAAYEPALRRINPAFERRWIEAAHVFRTPYAQPVVLTDYSAVRLPFETPLAGLYIANMTHIYPEDRGMNYALRTGYEVADALAGRA